MISRPWALTAFIACALLCLVLHSPVFVASAAASSKAHLQQNKQHPPQQSHQQARPGTKGASSASTGQRSRSRSRTAISSRGRGRGRGSSSTRDSDSDFDSSSSSSPSSASSSSDRDRTAAAERRDANLTSSDSVEAQLVQDGLWECVYHLHGIPKSGTTWLEMVVKRLDEYWCNRTAGCTHEEVDIARNVFTKNSAAAVAFTTTTAAAAARHNTTRLVTGANSSCGPRRLFAFMPKHLILPKIDMRGGSFLHTVKRDRACALVDPEATAEVYSRQMGACVSSVAHRLNASLTAPYKTLAIIRDPRATAVSFCHYVRKPVESCHYLSPAEFSLSVLRLRFAYEYWHAAMELSNGSKATLLLHYEDLSTSFHDSLARLNDFMDFPDLPSEAIELVEHETSMSTLASLAEAGSLPGSHQKEVSGHDGAKVFRGTVDGFLEDVGDQQLFQLNRIMLELLPPTLLRRYNVSSSDISSSSSDANVSQGRRPNKQRQAPVRSAVRSVGRSATTTD